MKYLKIIIFWFISYQVITLPIYLVERKFFRVLNKGHFEDFVFAIILGIFITILYWVIRRLSRNQLPNFIRGSKIKDGLWPIGIFFVWTVIYFTFIDHSPLHHTFSESSFIMATFTTLPSTVLGALREEFMYRGVLQGSLQRQTKAIYAILISSTIFSGVHLLVMPMGPMTIKMILIIFILGVLIGTIAYRIKTLFIPVILHAIWNCLVRYFYYTPSLW